MISIELEWRKFSVDLKSLEEKMRLDHGASYLGNSADSKLTLYFKDGSLTDNEIQNIKLWFKQTITKTEEDAKRALPSRNPQLAESLIAAEKAAILLITNFSTLTKLQKKIWMGLELTDSEIDSLA